MPKPAILEKEYTYKNTKAVVIDKSRDDLRDSELYTGQKTWRDKKKSLSESIKFIFVMKVLHLS